MCRARRPRWRRGPDCRGRFPAGCDNLPMRFRCWFAARLAPSLRRRYGALLGDGIGQRLGIERYLLIQRHTVGVVVLFKTGIEGKPRVPGNMFRAPAREVIYPCFHPNVLKLELANFTATEYTNGVPLAFYERSAFGVPLFGSPYRYCR